MTTQLAVQSDVSGVIEQVARGRAALAQAVDDFERLQVRDTAKAIQVAAGIINRRDIQVMASELVMDAERAIAKANPPRQGERNRPLQFRASHGCDQP